MEQKTRNLWIPVVALLAFVLIWLLVRGNDAPEREAVTYVNDAYGFSFVVPDAYEIAEYAPESVSVGRAEDGTFRSAADVRVYQAGEGSGHDSFETFVVDTLRNMCAADGPGETIFCDQVESRDSFPAETGISGEVLYLHRVHEDLMTGAQEIGSFGPVIVYDFAANVPGAQFAMLAVSPPADLASGDIDGQLVRSVAETVRIGADAGGALVPVPPQEGLPEAVSEKRQAIVAAAASGDYDAVASLASQEGFRYTFGLPVEGGFAAYLRDEDADREASGQESILDEMTALLSLPYGTQAEYYVWPSTFVKSADEWTDEDIAIMREVATDAEIEGYRSFGAYIGWRVGIRSDGQWVYFIAGD